VGKTKKKKEDTIQKKRIPKRKGTLTGSIRKKCLLGKKKEEKGIQPRKEREGKEKNEKKPGTNRKEPTGIAQKRELSNPMLIGERD